MILPILTHKHQKERKACIKPRRHLPRRVPRLTHRLSRACRIGDIGAIGVVEGLEGSAEGEPEGTKGAEDDEGEGVADDPFTDAAENHEEATEEEVYAWEKGVSGVRLVRGGFWVGYIPMSEAPLPPAPRQPMRSHDRGVSERRKPTRALHLASARSIL